MVQPLVFCIKPPNSRSPRRMMCGAGRSCGHRRCLCALRWPCRKAGWPSSGHLSDGGRVPAWELVSESEDSLPRAGVHQGAAVAAGSRGGRRVPASTATRFLAPGTGQSHVSETVRSWAAQSTRLPGPKGSSRKGLILLLH